MTMRVLKNELNFPYQREFAGPCVVLQQMQVIGLEPVLYLKGVQVELDAEKLRRQDSDLTDLPERRLRMDGYGERTAYGLSALRLRLAKTSCRFDAVFKADLRRHSFFHQRFEIVGRVAVVQHLRESRISVRPARVGPQTLLIIYPSEYDYLRCAVEPEEQTVLLEEFRPEPVLPIATERFALSKLQGSRIGRDHFRYQLEYRGEPFRAVFLLPSLRSAYLARFNFLD